MKTEPFNDPGALAQEFQKLADTKTSWKEEGVSAAGLTTLINNNLRLILEQTENPDTAPTLKAAMLALSKRMDVEENLNNPDGHNLSHKVMSIALGIFEEGVKPDWERFLPDILPKEILSRVTPDNPDIIKSGLVDAASVSIAWNKIALIAKKDWVDQQAVSLRTYGCKTAAEAVQYIIDHHLMSANLADFDDLTDADLTKLIENRPDLKQLIIWSNKVKDFPLEKLTQLTLLALGMGESIPLDRLESALQGMSRLESLFLIMCSHISEENLGNSLQNMHTLKKLYLTGCFQITGECLTKDKVSQLTELDVSGCEMIPEEKLIQILGNAPKLERLMLSNCTQITEKMIPTLPKLAPQLNELGLGYCDAIPEEKIAELIVLCPNLSKLDLTMLTQVTGEKLAEINGTANLREIYLSNCTNLSNDKLAECLKKFPHLTYLSLEGCEQIMGEALIEGLAGNLELTKLNLSSCFLITEEHVTKILEDHPTLTHLNLREKFSEEKLAEWRKMYPRVKITH